MRRFGSWLAVMVLACTVVTAAVAKERRIALIVSNANYQNTPTLNNPPLDAEAVAATFKDMRFDSVEVMFDAQADALRKRLRDFAIKARLADVAVIYYAGHGLEADGQNYLVPVDARLETDLDIAFETVGIDLAVRAVNGAKKLKLLILDACRNNPLAKGIRSDGKSRSFGTGLAPIETAGDVLVSYAAAAGQVAYDGPAGDNSPFAKALAQHLKAPGVDVRQVLGRVRDAVGAATGEKQKPFIYASLGGDPIYLVPPPDQTQPAPSPVVVDLTVADPEEAAVKSFLGDTSEFRFAYDMVARTGQPRGLEIRPRLPYFVSVADRGRALLEARRHGYFSPGEFGGWSVSYPLLDIVARRSQPSIITLSELVVEVEQSAADPTPYVGLVAPSDSFARLVVFNEGWSDVRKVTLEYDVVGLTEPSRAEIRARVAAKRNGGYAHTVSAGPFQDFAYLSLVDGLTKTLKDFPMYAFAFRNQPTEFGPDGRPMRIPTAGAPRGFAAWAGAHPEIYDGDKQGAGAWAVGRLIVEPVQVEAATVVADFVAPVPIYAPGGLGGGTINYNAKDTIAIRTDGSRYVVRKRVGYLLDKDTTTFRGLYPLTVSETSRHRMRVHLKGDGGRDLWSSDWIDAHVVVPRLSRKSADWNRSGGKGRPPFRGLQ